MLFEWDEAKAAANWKKHKVSFHDAMRVFADEYRKEYYDAAHSDDEERYILEIVKVFQPMTTPS